MSNAKAEEKKSKKTLWLILLLLLIIVALIGVIFFMKKDKDNGKDEGADNAVNRNVIVNEKNVDEVAAKFIEEERVPLGRYEVMMSTVWNFNDGTSVSKDAYVENVERNTNSVYFDLVRSDTKEVILASPIIPVGAHMDKITLDSDLDKGSYDCVCTYHLINEENKPVSKVSVGVTVNVKS